MLMAEVRMPESIGAGLLREQLLAVLRETLEGPAESWSYFIDARPDAALFGALAGLSAADASQPWAGTTIAAHAHHVAFGMADATRWIEGDHTLQDWAESWRVSSVSEPEWARLQARLRDEYARLRDAIASRGTSSEPALAGALGAIAHLVYHLGAIQQKRAALRAAR
jgi:hypothetical protein